MTFTIDQVVHDRRVFRKHPDGSECDHGTRDDRCPPGTARMGTCPCSPHPVFLSTESRRRWWESRHLTPQEYRTQAAAAAWVTQARLEMVTPSWAVLRAWLVLAAIGEATAIEAGDVQAAREQGLRIAAVLDAVQIMTGLPADREFALTWALELGEGCTDLSYAVAAASEVPEVIAEYARRPEVIAEYAAVLAAAGDVAAVRQ